MLANAFFYWQFNYRQLAWMCHDWNNNNKINRPNKRCLRLIYNEDLSEKDGSVSIHHRNPRTLAVELLKVFEGLNPVTFAETFPVRKRSQYNIRNYSYFAMPHVKTVNYKLESLSYIRSKLWDSIPSDMNKQTLLMNLIMLLRLANLICARAGFAKLVYKILDIFSQHKN